jgi:hypothetical protein
MVYGLLRALPGEPRSFATVAGGYYRQLDTGVRVSGPHDFAVRAGTARLWRQPRPPHPAANVRDDRETPLWVGRDGNDIHLIWVF